MTPAILIAFFTLLISFTTKLHLATASVLDTGGKWVQNGGDYYILPSFKGSGGGVSLATTGGKSCPLVVIQNSSETSLGLPLSISSPQQTRIISTDLNLNIKFTDASNCTKSSTWIVVRDDSAKVWSLGIGSAEDYPRNQTIKGWFKIHEYDHDYMFSFCSTSDVLFCKYVGIYTDIHGISRLALQEAAFAVEFKNADESSNLYMNDIDNVNA